MENVVTVLLLTHQMTGLYDSAMVPVMQILIVKKKTEKTKRNLLITLSFFGLT